MCQPKPRTIHLLGIQHHKLCSNYMNPSETIKNALLQGVFPDRAEGALSQLHMHFCRFAYAFQGSLGWRKRQLTLVCIDVSWALVKKLLSEYPKSPAKISKCLSFLSIFGVRKLPLNILVTPLDAGSSWTVFPGIWF